MSSMVVSEVIGLDWSIAGKKIDFHRFGPPTEEGKRLSFVHGG